MIDRNKNTLHHMMEGVFFACIPVGVGVYFVSEQAEYARF